LHAFWLTLPWQDGEVAWLRRHAGLEGEWAYGRAWPS